MSYYHWKRNEIKNLCVISYFLPKRIALFLLNKSLTVIIKSDVKNKDYFLTQQRNLFRGIS